MKKLLFILCSFLSMAVAFAAVNINTATVQELESLKGIGQKKAQTIVDYRTKNGAFKTIEEIQKVKGISEKTFKQIKKDIAISGETVVPEKKAGKKRANKTSKTAPAKQPVATK